MGIGFGLFFFSAGQPVTSGAYRALLEAARFADPTCLRFISIPERHFGEFGALFPNPSVVAAAVATITKKIQIRAGSVIVPLHNVVRLVEDWSIVDCLSNGRVGISLGSGWHVNDFALAPSSYSRRKEILAEQIPVIRRLWSTGFTQLQNGVGAQTNLRIFPRPIQPDLPLWITSSGSETTFRIAGQLGANVLTHLEKQDLDNIAHRIRIYREGREEAGLDPSVGIVTVMQHTFVHDDTAAIAKVTEALRAYVGRALELEEAAVVSGGQMSGQRAANLGTFSNSVKATLSEVATRKYVEHLGLIGSVDGCTQRVRDLISIGVDEIACLVDFHDSTDLLLEGLSNLVRLASRFDDQAIGSEKASTLARFLRPL